MFGPNRSFFTCRFLILALSMSAAGCGVQAPDASFPGRPTNEAPLAEFDATELVDAWVSMWNSYDSNLVDELFLADDRVTYFSSEKEGLIRGIDAVREHHRGFGFVEGGKPAEKELWVDDRVSIVYGATAVVTGTWYFGNRSDDRKLIQRGPMTFVYVREEDGFRLAHLHFASYDSSRGQDSE